MSAPSSFVANGSPNHQHVSSIPSKTFGIDVSPVEVKGQFKISLVGCDLTWCLLGRRGRTSLSVRIDRRRQAAPMPRKAIGIGWKAKILDGARSGTSQRFESAVSHTRESVP